MDGLTASLATGLEEVAGPTDRRVAAAGGELPTRARAIAEAVGREASSADGEPRWLVSGDGRVVACAARGWTLFAVLELPVSA